MSTDVRNIRSRTARAATAATAIGAISFALLGAAPAHADDVLDSLDSVSYEAVEREASALELVAGQDGLLTPAVDGDAQAAGTAAAGPTTDVSIERFAGADRFGTAAALSRVWGANPEVAYVVNGMNFPDALSAGPAAAWEGGPILSVLPNEIPAVIKTELQRLKPQKIVVVGGAGVVSDSVFNLLKSYTAKVDRVGGADRYETSRLIAKYAFGAYAPKHVFVASGANFPDALAAGPAAAYVGGPVLLANGTATLDAATKATIGELRSTTFSLIGGPGVVTNTFATQLKSAFPAAQIVRLAGADRYTTATTINKTVFKVDPDGQTIFLAYGLGFADAVTGGAIAGAVGAPLYLAQRNCLPAPAFEDALRLGVTAVALLGGTSGLAAGMDTSIPSCS